MVMVVANPVFEPGRRPGRLNAANEALSDQQAERVVYRLQRDGADVGPDRVGNAVRCDMWLTGHRPQNRQALSRDLNAAVRSRWASSVSTAIA
jgi:hypothetical protein